MNYNVIQGNNDFIVRHTNHILNYSLKMRGGIFVPES